MTSMTKLMAAVAAVVAAGCAGGAPKQQTGTPVSVAHETRSSGAQTAAAEHTCEHDKVAPEIKQAKGLLEQKKFGDAAALLGQAVSDDPDNGHAWQLYGFALHAEGKLDEALAVHQKAASFPKLRGIAMYNVACVHALQGDAEQAFAALDEAVAAGFAGADHMEKDPDLAALRADPRFAAAVGRARSNPQVAKKDKAAHTCEHDHASR